MQRHVTHSLATVAVLVVAVAVNPGIGPCSPRRTGLPIHFARDIAEGPPGVRIVWLLQTRRRRPASGGSWE